VTIRESSFRETSFRGKKPSGKVTIRETTVNQASDHTDHSLSEFQAIGPATANARRP